MTPELAAVPSAQRVGTDFLDTPALDFAGRFFVPKLTFCWTWWGDHPRFVTDM